MKDDSDSDIGEEINDQLNQIWTNAKDKRKQLLSHLTPYSKRAKPSLNNSLQPKVERDTSLGIAPKQKQRQSLGLQKQVLKLRQQLQSQVLQGKHKQLELDRLRKTAQKLAIEKKYLVKQLQQTHLPDENCSKVLNESSILPRGKSASAKKHKAARSSKNKQGKTDHTNIEKLQDLSKQRLVELVRSTSEYRSYVFYYDSNELSYLKRLSQQHKKNCERTPGEKEKHFWAPSELIHQLNVLNLKEQLDLSEKQISILISRLKNLFESSCNSRIQRLRENLQNRLRKAERAIQNSIPYELIQVARAKQRELSRWSSTKRNASLFK